MFVFRSLNVMRVQRNVMVPFITRTTRSFAVDTPHFHVTRKAVNKALNQESADETQTDYLISQAPWTPEEANCVKVIHEPTNGVADKLAYSAVQTVRFCFDKLSGYNHDKVSTSTIIDRILFLETVAGVPGMVGGSLRHLRSLRNMERDHGWINSLLAEAENERMHLLTFMKIKQPGLLFRMAVFLTQGVMWNGFFLMYLVSPKLAHRFVGYLEEEAVKTYTGIIEKIDKGQNQDLAAMKVPQVAIDYWKMDQKATMRDLLLQIRADEAHHRHANHVFAELPQNAPNPFNHGFPKLSEIQYEGSSKTATN